MYKMTSLKAVKTHFNTYFEPLLKRYNSFFNFIFKLSIFLTILAYLFNLKTTVNLYRFQLLKSIDMESGKKYSTERYFGLQKLTRCGTNFSGIRFINAKLDSIKLSRNASKRRSSFKEADFSGSSLRNADLSGFDFTGAVFDNADLAGADLSGAILNNTSLMYANLRNANLTNATLRESRLNNIELSFAKCKNADFSYADLNKSCCIRTCFENAVFDHAFIDSATLSGSSLKGAKLKHTSVQNSECKRIELNSSTDIFYSDFTGSDLQFSNSFSEAQLTVVAGIDSVYIKGDTNKLEKPEIGIMLTLHDDSLTYFQRTLISTIKKQYPHLNLLFDTFNFSSKKNPSIIESEHILQMVKSGVDILVVSPLDETASIQAIKSAFNSGVAIICYENTVLKADAQKFTCSTILSDNYMLGYSSGILCANWLDRQKNLSSPEIGILVNQSISWYAHRVEGFRDGILKTTNGRIKTFSYHISDTSETMFENAHKFIEKNNKLTLAWGDNEIATEALVCAVQNTRSKNRMYVFGTDINPEIHNFLRQRTILKGITIQNSRKFSEIICDEIKRVALGNYEYKETVVQPLIVKK